jgi:hypothetical protein
MATNSPMTEIVRRLSQTPSRSGNGLLSLCNKAGAFDDDHFTAKDAQSAALAQTQR